jgi:acetyl-CoA C-acetyltransferase
MRILARKSFSLQAAYLVAAKRTPIGSFLGSLAKLPAPQLSAVATKAVLEKAGVAPGEVQEAILGNVVSAGIGQAPARQAVIKAGLPESVTCTTINKVCSSGLKSAMYAAQSIAVGNSSIVLAGGMESMSGIPFYVQKHRKGHPFGDQTLVDGMMCDGLVDPYCSYPMGLVAEKTATELSITREAVDAYSITSYERLASAMKQGLLTPELAPVALDQGQSLA